MTKMTMDQLLARTRALRSDEQATRLRLAFKAAQHGFIALAMTSFFFATLGLTPWSSKIEALGVSPMEKFLIFSALLVSFGLFFMVGFLAKLRAIRLIPLSETSQCVAALELAKSSAGAQAIRAQAMAIGRQLYILDFHHMRAAEQLERQFSRQKAVAEFEAEAAVKQQSACRELHVGSPIDA